MLIAQSAPLRRLTLPLAAGLILLGAMMRGPAQAGNASFIIKSNEGYGILDCLSDGSFCGRAVADAWCASHSKGPAVAYGLASDVTGSTGLPAAAAPSPDDVIVTCKD